ncbi:MAG: hypothetical protein HQK68_12695 [Desulfamplus sp.]|nr:hypothetical protein [Desulfamplus sp.]
MQRESIYFKVFELSFILCLFVGMVFIDSQDTFAAQTLCLGDINGDGVVSASEVDSAIEQFRGLQAVESSCDEFQDNSISITSLQRIIDRHINGCSAKDWYEDDNTFESANIIIMKEDISKIPGYEPLQRRNLHNSDDEDWIKFYLQYGANYSIKVYDVSSDCDPDIELYDENKVLLKRAVAGYEGQNEPLSISSNDISTDGIYYAKIYPSKESEYKAGTPNNYKVSLSMSEAPALPGVVYGKVIPAVKGVVKSNGMGEALIDPVTGWYVMPHLAGSFSLWVEAAGYNYRTYIKIGEAQIIRHDIRL